MGYLNFQQFAYLIFQWLAQTQNVTWSIQAHESNLHLFGQADNQIDTGWFDYKPDISHNLIMGYISGVLLCPTSEWKLFSRKRIIAHWLYSDNRYGLQKKENSSFFLQPKPRERVNCRPIDFLSYVTTNLCKYKKTKRGPYITVKLKMISCRWWCWHEIMLIKRIA